MHLSDMALKWEGLLLLSPVRIVVPSTRIRVLLPGKAVGAAPLLPLVGRPPLRGTLGTEAALAEVGAGLHPVDGLVPAYLVLAHSFPAHCWLGISWGLSLLPGGGWYMSVR